MTTIPLHNGLPIIRDGKIGTEANCCCEPCCECSAVNINVGDVCGLQSVVISLQFSKLGECYPDGVNVTFSVTEADDSYNGLGFWNKTYLLSNDDGDVIIRVAVRCLGSVGPNGTNCWGVDLEIADGGCSVCFANPLPGPPETGLAWTILTKGITTDGVCCPSGFEEELLPPEFCDGFAATVEVTFVY